MFIVFGRITALKSECETILKKFYLSQDMLACYERADDGCSRDHCHFLARTESYKSMKSLRNQFSELCYKTLGERLRYQVKEYDETLDAEAYLCKGHKKDASVKPDIFINTYGIDVQECYDRFHTLASKIKQEKYTKATWKEVVKYIEENDPALFTKEFTPKIQWQIAAHMYDYYVLHERMIQGKFVQQMILNTIISQKFNSKTLKKSFLQEWCSDLSYWNGMEQVLPPGLDDDL